MLMFCDPDNLKSSFWDAVKVSDILLYFTDPETLYPLFSTPRLKNKC